MFKALNGGEHFNKQKFNHGDVRKQVEWRDTAQRVYVSGWCGQSGGCMLRVGKNGEQVSSVGLQRDFGRS